jgi:DNA-binding XRE family transcriptional regulator
MDGEHVRRAREREGLTQAGLAARAGVTRQLVGAVEAGRHVPGVEAALALAGALGRTVEDLFAPAAPARPALDAPLAPGQRVLVGRVGERAVCVPLPATGHEAWPVPDAVLGADDAPDLLPGAAAAGAVVLGCDPALGLAGALLPRSGPARLVAGVASSRAALAALAAGTCHAALVHGPADALPRPPLAVRRLHLCRWAVGLCSGGESVGPEELAERALPVVQREAGAASQGALLRALAGVGASAPPGPVADGHLDVARRVAATGGHGVTMEPAARALGLGFRPLEDHDVQLWVAAAHEDHPGIQVLAALLADPAFRRRLALLDGYDLDGCGEVLG